MGNAKRTGKYTVVTAKYTESGLTHREAMNLGQHIRRKNETVSVLKKDEYGNHDVIWDYVTPTPFENV